MITDYDYILAKSDGSESASLTKHLQDVSDVAARIARSIGLDENIARKGAVLHDIGKVSPYFQQTLKADYIREPGKVFRHEIASLFFISLLDENEKNDVVDMIVAHHKSVENDARGLGMIDMDDNIDSFSVHSKDFDQWSDIAVSILAEFGLEKHHISLDEAENNYEYALNRCLDKGCGCSKWKGLLMAADHFASSLKDKTYNNLDKLFVKPELSFYNRQNDLYPLSLKSSDSDKRHTIVTAPTGAGKTDFLLRRCNGRVFYTLPYQASINAMYERISSDLSDTDAYVSMLHAASSLMIEDNNIEEMILQRHVGASVKVLTPHQIASVVFGIKGYESMALDIQGCDVILDEIHTYSDVIQAIVLRVVEVLIHLNCRVHIGTATMPSVLYDKIMSILGGADNVYEVKLSKQELTTYNRHVVGKIENFDCCINKIDEAVSNGQRILIVCNQVKRAQERYTELKSRYSDVRMLLIHSRFKRGRRKELENLLKNEFNDTSETCIVVSTQVVEVSLDISFDMMITECAPIDSLIQRFGRINRKRSKDNIGVYKKVYVISPSDDKKKCMPYSVDVLRRSFDMLPNGELLKETDVQMMLDKVYPEIMITNIDFSGVAFADGRWTIKELCHRQKSSLLEVLDIDSATCVTESDKEEYKICNTKQASELEIPVSYRSVGYKKLEQINCKTMPFVIPDRAYSDEMGLVAENIRPEFFGTFEIF